MSDAPRYLVIGRVLKPWSYRGELKIEILTEFPDRFASLRQVFVGDDAEPFSVERAHRHGKFVLLKLAGVDSETDAEKLRDQLVQVSATDAVPLKPGQVYLYQLVGLTVKTVEGETLGKITEILDSRAHDVIIVSDGTHEILIPAIPEFLQEINIERGEVIVKLIAGMTDT